MYRRSTARTSPRTSRGTSRFLGHCQTEEDLDLAEKPNVVLALRGAHDAADVDEDVVGDRLRKLAIDFRTEETIFDTLAHSVTGDLLTSTYLDARRGLELAYQRGALARLGLK